MNRSDDLFPQPGGTPDPYWQRAFDDASDTPPPRVWEGVERQLDLDESDGILPLWQHRQGRQSMLFGRWVAGIAASLMLTALGWWAWHREDAIRPDMSVAVAPKPMNTTPAPGNLAPVGPTVARAEAAKAHTLPMSGFADASSITRSRYQTNQPGTSASGSSTPGASTPGTYQSAATVAIADKRTEQAAEAQVKEKQVFNSFADQTQGANGTLIFTETTLSMTMRLKEAQPFPSGVGGIQSPTGVRSSVTGSITMRSFGTQSMTDQSQFGQLPPANFRPATAARVPDLESTTNPTAGDSPERVALAGAPLAAKPSALRRSADDRIAVTTNEETGAEPATTASKKQRQRPWLSAGVVASAYNPTVALRSAFSPSASSPQSMVPGTASAAAPTLQSQAGSAVAFLAGIGIPLGEHWSIETGVGYLNSQNQVQSPARVASLTTAVKSATADNLYVDLIARMTDQSAVSAYSLGAANVQYDAMRSIQPSNYAPNQQQAVSNAYQFVQVPVQVGYELRPRRKLGFALLTGMVSNWFVRNTVAESITVKASDGVYRPVTLAGTAGMRLRYRPDNHWSASVAGTFQQSLQSLTRAEVSLQAQPQQVGLSFTVDRHF
ncbi:MAG TPA: hypothetical protein VGA96_00215 [Fibrella sp.]